MICRNRNKKEFIKIADIGKQPISSLFLTKKKKIKDYSLDLYKCKFCDLVQLSKIPNLKLSPPDRTISIFGILSLSIFEPTILELYFSFNFIFPPT